MTTPPLTPDQQAVVDRIHTGRLPYQGRVIRRVPVASPRAITAARFAHLWGVTCRKVAIEFGVEPADVVAAWNALYPNEPRYQVG